MCIIALFSGILIAQKELLAFLPNIQLTFFFIILYSKTFGFKNTSFIVLVYYFVDCAIFGTWNPIFIAFNLFAWELIPITMCFLFKKIENPFLIMLIGILLSFIYSWILIIPSIIVYQVDFIPYLLADLPFEGILACSTAASCLLMYKPLKKLFDKQFI